MEPSTKATPREAREHNQRLVLATIYDDGPISRAEVARRTKLTRTSVSDVVDGLLATGLVAEVGRGPSTGGKAPILLAIPDMARSLIGVDLGDRTFVAASVNLRGEILHRAEVPSEDADGAEALELALHLVSQVVEAAQKPVLGIGIGAPGLVDTTDGTVIQAVKRSWRGVSLGPLVADRFGLPVHVANDSQVAALAEHVFGSARATNVIVIKVGEGIGAGLVLNGTLFQGDGFGAGEIGHAVVDRHGPPCRCGQRGCLETVASARALRARLTADLGRPVTLDEAVTLLERGDERVLRAVEEAGEYLGWAVGGLIGALHVRRIVLAGAMAGLGEPWLAAVRTAAHACALKTLASDTTIELGAVDDIVVLGASALLMTRELGLSLRRRPTPAGPTLRTPVNKGAERPSATPVVPVPTGARRGGVRD